MALLTEMEPISFDQAVKESCLIEAMKEEIRSIEKNNTQELTTLPKDEHGIYTKGIYTQASIIICLYVDDLLITNNESDEIERLRAKLKLEFVMSDLGNLSYFLGIEFSRTNEGILIHQRKYIANVFERFNMLECNSASKTIETSHTLRKENYENSEAKLVYPTLYREMIGSLRYICNTRPDLAYSVKLVSRYMENPKHSHMLVVKRILRYLKGSMDFGVMFSTNRSKKTQ
ncbi:PREDICTED: uncharacterized protein LOC109361829 [Lupinus angustifolius]|uniref:uncharacterized protein LOC109361829 n=1 Tax=Lupinus angustifolius TaxID=3871 RepID=UPI00092F3874|nr:PREDICTED: uncharacterized protein LOC109361829 [Lupinus angustifolius]